MQYINTSKSTTVKDIAAHDFINAFAAYLKKSGKFKVPEVSDLISSGLLIARPLVSRNWALMIQIGSMSELVCILTVAAIARQIYFRRSIGLTSLRAHFGGKVDRGVRPSHQQKGSGKLIRYCLKQLSDMGIVGIIKEETEDDAGKTQVFRTLGRQITKKGTTDMDRVSSLVAKEQRKNWELIYKNLL
jgi:small subunit ribosomal protein S19e